MKTLFVISMALFLLAFNHTIKAQGHNDQNNYLVLTKQIQQLQPIILTAEALAKEDGPGFGDFQVVICGQTVKELTDKHMMKKFIHKAEQSNIKLVICGFSLDKFEVDREELPEGLEIVENGILYGFQLQKKGYLSIEL